jgi:26S proteasome regulatory subunit N12
MSTLERTVKLFDDFKQSFDKPTPDLERCKHLMGQLKIGLMQLSIPLPGSAQLDLAQHQKELLLAREILEHAVLLSVKTKDIPSFERYIAQVKTYYYDYGKNLPPSQRQYPILGLNLLRLLAQNRIAEFHAELELIPLEMHQNVYIRHPIMLEQYIMEGSYHKVRNARADVPVDTYTFFTDILMETIRDEIAECSEKAFTHLPLPETQRLLQIPDTMSLNEYINKRGWAVYGDGVVFQKPAVTKAEIPSMQLIHETLTYAKELERIV